MKINHSGGKRWILFTAIAVTLLAGAIGCSEFNSPSAPAETSNSFVAPDNGSHGDGTLDGGGRGGGGGGSREGSSGDLGLPPPDCASATIGENGGILWLHNHMLIVPAGAVRRNTDFQMCANPNSEIGVDLYPEGLNFHGSVWLWMSYYGTSFDDGPGGFDPANLAIFYVPNNGGQNQQLVSTVNFGQYIVGAELEHFSRYIVGQRTQ